MGIETFEIINDEAYKDGVRYDLVFVGSKGYLVFDPDHVYAVLNKTDFAINAVQVINPLKLEKILNEYFSLFDE